MAGARSTLEYKGQPASDRASSQSRIANRFRLVFRIAAYWLVLALPYWLVLALRYAVPAPISPSILSAMLCALSRNCSIVQSAA